MKILFCLTIFFRLLNAIASNEDVFEKMSPEERRSFFGTEDGSIPEYEVVELVRPSRSKRSDSEPLNITFNAFGTLLTATLYVVDDQDLISRWLTGVWYARYDANAHQNVNYAPWPDVFDGLGYFEFLQNPDDGSAVTRFWDSNGDEKIVGVLKQNYTVKCVPEEFEYAFVDINRKHSLGKRSVNSTNDHDDKKRLYLTVFKNAGVPQEYFRRHTYAKNDALPDPRLHRPTRQSTNPTQVPDVVYPKLLIIPDASTVKRYSQPHDFLKQLIAQLNCVDMIFRQLEDPEVHLIIAGIIIPEDDAATPYIANHIGADNLIDGDAAKQEAQLNFFYENRRFPHDEWDAILMLSTYAIGSYDNVTGGLVEVNGLSGLGDGCSGGVAFAKFTENMDGIYTLAHELGHTYGVQHDEEETKAGECKDADGYLMVNGYDFAQKLEWSTCSRTVLQNFFRSDEGNCTYVRPDDIADVLKKMPGAWLPIEGQCDNIHNDSTHSCIDHSSACIVFGCLRNGACDWILAPPMEGSLFYNDNTNVLEACINQTWIPV